MIRFVMVSTALLAACGQAPQQGSAPVQQPAVVPPAPLDPVTADPGIDPARSQGYTADQHVMLAPGLYLRADLYATGRYGLGTELFTDLGLGAPRADMSGTGGYTTTTTGTTDTGYPDTGYGFPDVCVEYDDGIVSGTEDDIFVHDLDWSLSATAYSSGGGHFVTAYPYIAVSSLDYDDRLELFHSDAYLFLNGEYVAFFQETQVGGGGAAPIDYLFVPCDDGYLDVTALGQVEARDGDQALKIENRADAIIACCPTE